MKQICLESIPALNKSRAVSCRNFCAGADFDKQSVLFANKTVWPAISVRITNGPFVSSLKSRINPGKVPFSANREILRPPRRTNSGVVGSSRDRKVSTHFSFCHFLASAVENSLNKLSAPASTGGISLPRETSGE